MALEAMGLPVVSTTTEYTCPMHPEIVQVPPGHCHQCGLALEPRPVAAVANNEELIYMSRRFWFSSALALPVLLLSMLTDLFPAWLPN